MALSFIATTATRRLSRAARCPAGLMSAAQSIADDFSPTAVLSPWPGAGSPRRSRRKDAAAGRRASPLPTVVDPDPTHRPENVLLLDLSNGGRVAIRLMPEWAPGHVERIKTLVRAGLLQRHHLPPRDRRLHGADRRSDRHRRRAARSCPTSRPNSTRCRTCAARCRWRAPNEPDTANSQFFIVLLPALRARPEIYRVRPGDRRHGRGRCDRARRAAGEPDQDRPGLDGAATTAPPPALRRRTGRGTGARSSATTHAATSSTVRELRASSCQAARRLAAIHARRPVRFRASRPSGSRCARRGRAMRRGCWWCAGERGFADRRVRDLPRLLRAGDVLVFNDTRVIPAQLEGQARRGADRRDPAQADRPAPLAGLRPQRQAAARGRPDRFRRRGLRHAPKRAMPMAAGRWPSPATSRSRCCSNAPGTMPLPPYIAGKRPTDEADRSDYQTMFAASDGAVAAPTAALHFTPDADGGARSEPGSATKR